MNGPEYNGDHDRMSEGQLETLRFSKSRLSDEHLRRAYKLYVEELFLAEDGTPPTAAKVQYFVETWRLLRKRQGKPAEPV